VCELLHGEVDIVLDSSDQSTRGFLALIVFKRLFPKHACKLFGEMTMKIKIIL
jgi:hypothetical protein